MQGEDGIRDLVRSRGLGDVYRGQDAGSPALDRAAAAGIPASVVPFTKDDFAGYQSCLLYTSDAADALLCVDLGGRRITKKKTSVLRRTLP